MQRNHLTLFILLLGMAVVPGIVRGATFQVATNEALLAALYDAATTTPSAWRRAPTTVPTSTRRPKATA